VSINRVVVVDDSALQRRIISAVLDASAELTVVGQAESAEQALDLVTALQPDIVTMDLQMAGEDGLVASERILNTRGVPIILLTASATLEDQVLVARAFAVGVLAVLPKPQLAGNDGAIEELQRTVSAYARVRVMRRNAGRVSSPAHNPAPGTGTPAKPGPPQLLPVGWPPATNRPAASPQSSGTDRLPRPQSSGTDRLPRPQSSGTGGAKATPSRSPTTTPAPLRPVVPAPSSNGGPTWAGRGPTVCHPRAPEVIAIGASTGGPQALSELLLALPPDFPVPIVVVQHIVPGFTASLTAWLASLLLLKVDLASDLMALGAGVHFAPSGQHLLVRMGSHGPHLRLADDSAYRGHRPSVSRLFESLATCSLRSVGVLLTGMGDDGASGLLTLRQSGNVTIAQDEASCVIYGMPAAAVRLGAASHVLPPSKIAALLLRLVERGD
jgi:two-component system, chemotaxis family, protein-glutamate methylesterase/glutaminase